MVEPKDTNYSLCFRGIRDPLVGPLVAYRPDSRLSETVENVLPIRSKRKYDATEIELSCDRLMHSGWRSWVRLRS